MGFVAKAISGVFKSVNPLFGAILGSKQNEPAAPAPAPAAITQDTEKTRLAKGGASATPRGTILGGTSQINEQTKKPTLGA